MEHNYSENSALVLDPTALLSIRQVLMVSKGWGVMGWKFTV